MSIFLLGAHQDGFLWMVLILSALCPQVNTVSKIKCYQSVKKPAGKPAGFSLSIKSIYRFYFSCGSTHKIEFAQQIHNSRGRVPRELYKGRKIVPVGRGFSSRFD